MDVPSLLHVLDKSDLTRYIIKKDANDEKNEGYLSRQLKKGGCKFKNEAPNNNAKTPMERRKI